MNTRKILDVIFWIALIIGTIMVLWRIFGNSPTDLAVITPFIVMGLTKIWSNNNRIWELEIKMKNSFDKVRENTNRIGNKIDDLLNKLNGRKNKYK
ncbi:MAG: hypothetical protein KKB79_01125 [Nanoarchaeota archaeon]|nr:hypothetical protein [Nanoarchaeota archaeon]